MFSLLIDLKETKCLFFWDKHKTKQKKLQYGNYLLSKRNENVQNYISSDQKKNIIVFKGNIILLIKTKRRVFSGSKNQTLTSAFLHVLHERIAPLRFHYTVGYSVVSSRMSISTPCPASLVSCIPHVLHHSCLALGFFFLQFLLFKNETKRKGCFKAQKRTNYLF